MKKLNANCKINILNFKMKKQTTKRAQAITEYAVIFACLAASLIVMQAYIRRGLSGKLKDVVDSNLGTQFDPYAGSYKSVTSQWGDTVDVSRQLKKEGEDGETLCWYNVVYSVSGPQSYVDKETGKTMIEEDKTRDPSSTMTYQVSEIDWEELNKGN